LRSFGLVTNVKKYSGQPRQQRRQKLRIRIMTDEKN
jgi:hypothetical protein